MAAGVEGDPCAPPLQEIFNHVLDDVEIFTNKIIKAKQAYGGSSQKKRNKRRTKNGSFALQSSAVREEATSDLWFLPQL